MNKKDRTRRGRGGEAGMKISPRVETSKEEKIQFKFTL